MFRRMPRAAWPIEIERVVDFEKVIVAADLNGPVAGVPHDELGGLPPDIGLDRRGFKKIFAWFHQCSLDWIVNRYQFCSVGKRGFHLDFVNHRGDPVHHVARTQNVGA